MSENESGNSTCMKMEHKQTSRFHSDKIFLPFWVCIKLKICHDNQFVFHSNVLWSIRNVIEITWKWSDCLLMLKFSIIKSQVMNRISSVKYTWRLKDLIVWTLDKNFENNKHGYTFIRQDRVHGSFTDWRIIVNNRYHKINSL